MTDPSPHSPLRLGDTDPRVRVIRDDLRRAGYPAADDSSVESIDRAFDSVIRSFQQHRGLLVDGIVGPQTWRQLEQSRYRLGDRVLRYDPVREMLGDDVSALQFQLRSLGIYADIIDDEFGPKTETALKELQRDLGLAPDGVCGPATLRGLKLIRRRPSGGNPYALGESAWVSSQGSSLSGKLIVIEALSSHDDLARDIARRLEGRLAAVGSDSLMLGQGEYETQFPDRVSAHLVVSIGVDHTESPLPNGLAAFYYGTREDAADVSPLGSQLADLIRRELLSRTDVLDGRTHARTWAALRQIRTPKVQVNVGYSSNAHDLRRLSRPEFRDTVAEGIVVAIQRLFLPQQSDPQTGTLEIAAIVKSNAAQ